MTNIIHSDDSNFDESFNLEALHKAYETGILNKDDFANDEHWCLAMDIFESQTSEELEIPSLTDIDTDLEDGLQMVEDFTNPASNPNNWGLSPLRDAALRRQMALDPDWDAKQLSAELDPEIDEMINRFNNRHSLANTEDENEDFPVRGDENTRYFGHFQADFENFDWDNNYVETGFPDGQFLANGLDAPASAFLAECWRSHNTDGAYDYIEMIESDELRERISRVYDLCDGSHLFDRSTVEFVWEQETLSDVCDDPYPYGLGS
ncbi:hypothetical protein DSM106972_097450 [Dulcicalothrix desertica PCC 7102]|uniref:Uncharacterized protein n=1 Tax=Dulcicalothrix desertica PCC 7102 TaxID=232991 RepID=A0A433UGV2_9CYAN|nr:hypothetical protein [Dulcicalothrix desertica]RUS93113.1 hypothetical protein DSM106972_097450 [Dulcicalothrix desertica PCC 7102]TWH61189.1 hypothetical protein CAL7102_01044 [Dulcicalothrix desertica PCC 7102]